MAQQRDPDLDHRPDVRRGRGRDHPSAGPGRVGQDRQPVRAVPVPPTQPVWNSRDPAFAFPDSGPVGFEPDTAAFRDPSAAYAALRRLAGYLAANSPARIELTGTTARWGSLAGCRALAQQRANTVKAVLVQMGARPSQIVTRGLGWRFPGYENDQGPDGTLLPGPAEHTAPDRHPTARSLIARCPPPLRVAAVEGAGDIHGGTGAGVPLCGDAA